MRLPVASFGTYLFSLALALAVPVVAFAGFLVLQLQESNEAALQRRTVREAQALAVSVERQLQDIATTLRVLSSAPELESGDLQGFHERSRTALANSPLFVLLLSEDGQQLLNTRVPFGTPLGKTANLASMHAAIASGDVEVSEVFFGKVSEKWVFNVVMPLPTVRPGQVILITQNAEELDRLMVPSGLPNGWAAAIVDGQGAVIAATGETTVSRGEPLLVASLSAGSGSGFTEKEGAIVGYAHLTDISWQAIVWGPVATGQATIFDNWGMLLIGVGLLLALTIGLSVTFGNLIRQSVRQLAKQAMRLGLGEVVPPLTTPFRELNEVSVTLTNASFDRHSAEDQLTLVVKELRHRTKNMLTVVMAMVRQSARTFELPPLYLSSVEGRLQGLAASIDLLSSEKWTAVPLKLLLKNQLDKFVSSPGQLVIHGEDLLVAPEAVQVLGLAFHELGTNAVKYGALSVPDGHVRIHWMAEETNPSTLVLSWEESGGPPVRDPVRQGFGSTVIGSHIESTLGGIVEMAYLEEGFRWRLLAPLAAVSGASAGDQAQPN